MTKAVMPALLRARDIMTQPVVSLPHDMGLTEAAETLSQRQISGAPVLYGSRVVGVVSKSDLVDPRHSAETRIDRVMTKALYAVRASDPLILAVQLMVEEGVHRVLVMDDTKQITGIIVPFDVCRAVLRNATATLGRGAIGLDYVAL